MRLAQHYFCRWPSFLDLGWSWEEASGRTKPLRIVFTCQAAMKQSNKRHAKNEQIQSHRCCGVIAYFVPKSGMPIYVMETQEFGNYLSWSQHTWTFWKVRASKSWIFRMSIAQCSLTLTPGRTSGIPEPLAAGAKRLTMKASIHRAGQMKCLTKQTLTPSIALPTT